jgi:hypothetical protein
MEVQKLNKTQTLQLTIFALGVTLCLAGAILMIQGSIFGERTVGVAIVTSIVGIGLISASHKTRGLKGFNKSQSKTANVNNEGR